LEWESLRCSGEGMGVAAQDAAYVSPRRERYIKAFVHAQRVRPRDIMVHAWVWGVFKVVYPSLHLLRGTGLSGRPRGIGWGRCCLV
jgi:hypothetical protein